jgi:hypothetical protein
MSGIRQFRAVTTLVSAGDRLRRLGFSQRRTYNANGAVAGVQVGRCRHGKGDMKATPPVDFLVGSGPDGQSRTDISTA